MGWPREGGAGAGLALLLPLQIPIPSPPPLSSGGPRELAPVGIEDMYGPVQVEGLDQLANNGQSYHRRLVQTRGRVADLVPGQYLMLEDGAAQRDAHPDERR